MLDYEMYNSKSIYTNKRLLVPLKRVLSQMFSGYNLEIIRQIDQFRGVGQDFPSNVLRLGILFLARAK